MNFPEPIFKKIMDWVREFQDNDIRVFKSTAIKKLDYKIRINYFFIIKNLTNTVCDPTRVTNCIH